MTSVYIYIFIMAASTYFIRIIPLILLRKQIKNQFVKSFLYYVPYVTLSIMTFPAIINATQNSISGIAALIIGVLLAWFDAGLFKVSVFCCLIVFIAELLL